MGITGIMQRALSGAWLRHELLANNVANSETPGYKAERLDFEDYLREAIQPRLRLAATNPLHVQKGYPGTAAVTLDRSSVTPDGNSVDIDREMAEVSANALYYTAVSRQLIAQFSLLRKAITEGRR
ncbi:MAG TPA: flagellar basal body rod protein FlgB [Firmicutes bacterium]|nr:flagellar basal body rod protein FlgB [Candidatus Fermentithermobacillaceae bacterium]